MKIIMDGFGGDHAPKAVLEGAAAAVKEYGVDILITGKEKALKEIAKEENLDLSHIEIADAPDVITMEDDPVSLLKGKSQSSLAVGFHLLKEGKGDALVSGGSTGAIAVGANFIAKRIKGIKRAGLASVIPTLQGTYLLMDCGATLDCKGETLLHYGLMGSIYMEKMFGLSSPRVGLLNIGTEETKGDEIHIEAFRLLSESGLNFVGNVEARDLPFGEVDVAVADGFSGNVALKMTEGVALMFSQKLKEMFLADLRGKVAAVMIKDKFAALKASMDYTEYGGAPLLGVNYPVIKAHGSSNAKAFKNAVRQAIRFSESNMIGEIAEKIAVRKEEKA